MTIDLEAIKARIVDEYNDRLERGGHSVNHGKLAVADRAALLTHTDQLQSELTAARAEVETMRDRLKTTSAYATKCEGEIATLRATVEKLRGALGFAASVIKSGEPWTPTCEREIGDLLESFRKARQALSDTGE